MSPSLFLVCLFLIAACTELGAVTDKEKGMNDTTLFQLFHHINKRQLKTKDISKCTCTCDKPDIPSGCDVSEIIPSTESLAVIPPECCDSQLSSLNDKYSRMCTSDCAGALVKYYRCLASDQGEDVEENLYIANYIEKYTCGKESGDYCPVKLIRSFREESYAVAYINILQYCPIPFNSTDLASCKNTSCTSELMNFRSAVGCCMEPFLGSDVRSCSGVSVPGACAGLSSATGIIATPIVGVSLMILALAGVFL